MQVKGGRWLAEEVRGERERERAAEKWIRRVSGEVNGELVT